MVINYDFPPSAISYIHRIGIYIYDGDNCVQAIAIGLRELHLVCWSLLPGRTGRAGRQGQAVTFFTEDDAVNLRR